MKTDIKNLSQSEIEMLVQLDPTEWGKFVDGAARELGKEVKIEGFRPGNAPKELVEQRVGQGKILERAADEAVRQTFVKIVQEKNLEVIGRPEIQVLKIAKDNPFEFKVKVAVLPKVKLGDYRKIAGAEKMIKPEDIKVEEKEIADSLAWLQKSRTKYATVLRPAQTGDRVEIDFTAKKDEQVIEGGVSKNHPLVIGEGHFVPGFEEHLAGLKENEEKKFSLVFPENFQTKELAGQLINFEAKMNLVQEPQAPELDDEFAKSLGQFETLEALKNNIKEGLTMEKEQKAKEAWRVKVLQEIVKKSDMELPPVLVQTEQQKMLEEFKNNLSQMGLEMETYLQNLKKTPEEFQQEWQPKAVERVKAGLVLSAIAERENIEVTEAEMQEEIDKLIKHYPDWEAVKAQIDMRQLLEYAKGRLKNEKVFEMLEKI